MSVFNAKYISDDEIWLKLKAIIDERNNIHTLLSQNDINTDPLKTKELAIKLHELEQICEVINDLKSYAGDLRDLNEMSLFEDFKTDIDFQRLLKQTADRCNERAVKLYNWLMQKGMLDEEIEDEKDMQILTFLDYAGAEYAWRLGINIGIDVVEARERLERLLEKGLLEKVQGTMLENYHRAKDWTKHMNHTYYRISRQGKHYLRQLRTDGDYI
ncbi:hypothetical protein Dtox_2271 [Desulfofarcimen acetoxidans DSM 771]|uniref:DUF2250 domain-containing protein n=1 Tax=Desulfofarcimen acetoxidans (strain ATCC 49208 / DSM 771 / KCTC 5769 / VKM B-1644 / 5575) TaxID=485916 RepID=C8VZV7_DESAS|nr:DUF2250 domain-containing protein [Desulfofarcimen acetoxidans]ACV63085.1 hypothetical protein Dtox_2271 [Desulfofarcimen acetoxidans DSM 771]